MTVRELVQTLLLEAPDLDAEIYISKKLDDIESKSYNIVSISNEGSNDGVFIEIKDWHL